VFGLTDSYVITFISDMYHLCLDSAGIVDGRRYYDVIKGQFFKTFGSIS